MSDAPILETEFNGLTSAQPSLPASWYFDPEHHARELREIWGSSWIYAGRAESLPEAGDYLSFDVGGQSLVVLRGDEGGLHGYFNTCRHRGAALCEKGTGTCTEARLTPRGHGEHGGRWRGPGLL